MKKTVKLISVCVLAGALVLGSGCQRSIEEGDDKTSETGESASTSATSTETAETTETVDLTQNVVFMGETIPLSMSDPEYLQTDQDGNPSFALFRGFAYIGFADENAPSFDSRTTPEYFDFEQERFLPDMNKHEYSAYQKITEGQEINGMTVSDTQAGFDFIDGEWQLTNVLAIFTGEAVFKGELYKVPEGEVQMFAPGTLLFEAKESVNGLLPLTYDSYNYFVEWSDDYAEASPALYFILGDYEENDVMKEQPELFSESDTVYVKATLSEFRLINSNRMSGGNWGTLTAAELLEE
ncbi:MAG: hypothetical protein FWG83_01245 [Oscillospiraceae bacterium]|nr:hypothetical protein [Oscillospiraceae bacterium]